MPTHNDEKAAQAAARRQRLQGLWKRRDHLNEAEWTELYIMVYHILIPPSGQNINLLAELPEAAEIYVDGFFTEKVFRPTVRENFNAQFIYPGALRGFFCNYLKDRRNEIERQPRLASLQRLFPKAVDSSEQDDSLLDHLSPTRFHPQWQPLEEDRWLLWEAGLDDATLMAATSAFYRRLTPDEQLIFRENFVAGKKLSTLNSTIPNVYTIASRLGLSVNRQRIKDFSRQTKIGQWLTQPPDADPPGLGLTLHNDDWDLLLIVLQMLRIAALEEGNTG